MDLPLLSAKRNGNGERSEDRGENETLEIGWILLDPVCHRIVY